VRPGATLLELEASEVACVATDQPGDLDSSCPDRSLLTLTFSGCCRPSGECGFLADLSGLGFPSLGCVACDAFDGAGTPGSCTP